MKKKLLILCSSIVTTFSLASVISCGTISELRDRILFSWKKYLDEIPNTVESIKVFEKIMQDIPASQRLAGQELSKTQLGIDFTDKFPSWATPEIKLSQNWNPTTATDHIYLDVKLTTPDRSSSSTKQVKVTFCPVFDYQSDLIKIENTFTSLRSAKRIFQAIKSSFDNQISKDDLVDAKDIGYKLPQNITKGVNIFFKVNTTWQNPELANQKINLVLDAWLEKEGQINKSNEKTITIETSSFEWKNFLDQISDYYISDMNALQIREKIPREQRKFGSILSFEKIGVANPFEGNGQDINPEIKIKEEWNGTSALKLSIILKKDAVANSVEKTMVVTPLSHVVPFNFSQDIVRYQEYIPSKNNVLILKNTQRYLENSIKDIDLKVDSVLTSEQIGMYVLSQTKGLRSTIKLQGDWQLQTNSTVDAKVKLTLSGEYPEGVNPVSFGQNDILVRFKAQDNVYQPLYALIASQTSNATTNQGIIEITSNHDLATLQSNILERYLNADVSLEKLGIRNFPTLSDFVSVSPDIQGGIGIKIKKIKYKLKMEKDWDGNSDISVNIIFLATETTKKGIKLGNSWPYKFIIKARTI